MHGSRIAETNLSLGRMDVDVDQLRLDLDEEHDGGMTVEVEIVGGAAGGVREDLVFHQPAVDEEVLIAAAAETESARDVAGGVDAVNGHVDFFEKLFGVVADDLRDTLAHRRRWREVDDGSAVVLDAKGARRQRQRV